MKPHRILFAALLASTILAFTPNTTAQSEENLLETFDQYAAGFYPPLPEDDWVFADYATSGAVANEVGLLTSPSVTGNAIRMGGHSGSVASSIQAPLITFADPFACDGNTNEMFEFDFRIGTGVVDDTNIAYRIQLQPAVADTSDFEFVIFDNDASLGVQARITTTTGATQINSLGTLTTDEWWHFTMLGFNCADEEVFMSMAKTADGSSLTTAFVNGASLAGTISPPSRFTVFSGTSSSLDTIPLTYFDNLEVTTESPVEPDAGSIFCSDVSDSDNFGYDYVEQVTFEEDADTGPGGLQDAFLFDGDSSDSEYLGKAFTPGTKAISTVARIESGIAGGGESSIFRIAYTTGAATLSAGSSGDGGGDMTAAGDGEDTGNFEDNIQAYFLESGDTWNIRIRYNVGGAGLVTLGASANNGDPDDPGTWIFEVNSGATDLDPHPIANISATYEGFPALPAYTARVLNRQGDIVLSRDLPASLYDFEWKDQWFVGKGDSIIDADTFLDQNDPDLSGSSTCIYDLLGTAIVVGSSGTEPNSEVPGPIDEEDGNGGGGGGLFDPDNLDENLFVGFLLVAGMVFIGVRQGVGQAAISALAAVGLFLGYALGWIPLWIIIVLTILGLAVVFLFGGQKADGVS